MHQNAPLSDTKIKKKSGEGHTPKPLLHWGRGYPLPTPPSSVPSALRFFGVPRSFSFTTQTLVNGVFKLSRYQINRLLISFSINLHTAEVIDIGRYDDGSRGSFQAFNIGITMACFHMRPIVLTSTPLFVYPVRWSEI